MNRQHRTARISLRKAPEWYRRAAYRGWCDAIEGLPYSPEYDGMSYSEQLAYEGARHIHANIRAAGLRAPWWNGTAALADEVEYTGRRARLKIGDPIAPDWVIPA
jgi:hypothetical protein